jgi:phosphohistidine phosphatase
MLRECFGDRLGRTDPLEVIANDVDGFVHVIGERQQGQIMRADVFIVAQFLFHPAQQSGPVFFAEEDEREFGNAFRLDQGEHFKQFVQRAKAAGHVHEGDAVLHETDFAGEKVMKVHGQIGVGIAFLLMRQFDIQADGFAFAQKRAFVRGFHDTGAAARDDGNVEMREAFAQLDRSFVILVIGLGARRTINSDRRANMREGFKGFDKFAHNAKHAPGVFLDEMRSRMIHGGETNRRRKAKQGCVTIGKNLATPCHFSFPLRSERTSLRSSMNLFLLRHGVAVDRDPHSFPDDARRPLTLKGEDRIRLVSDAMRGLELSFDRIISSPYLRARQTAELVASALGLRSGLEFSETLAPDGDPKALFRLVNRVTPRPENLLLVGHEPYLSQLLSVLISGQPDAAIDFKKNGLAKMEVAQRLKFGRCATLNWLLTPRQLGLLA